MIMDKLRIPQLFDELRQQKDLKEKFRDVTRWISTFQILKRNKLLRKHMWNIDDDKIYSLLLNNTMTKKL